MRAAFVVLVAAFLAVGIFREDLLDGLQHLLAPSAPDPRRDLASLRSTGGGVFTTRPVVPMAAYGLLYVAVSLALLHVLLGARWTRTRLMVALYGGALVLAGLLLALGRLTGLATQLTPPARALIDLVTSPTPVLLALAVFWLAAPQLQKTGGRA